LKNGDLKVVSDSMYQVSEKATIRHLIQLLSTLHIKTVTTKNMLPTFSKENYDIVFFTVISMSHDSPIT